MKRIIVILSLLLSSTYLWSQNPSDVLRFSENFNAGTARYVSMGGAFGSLGADFTSLSSNPAGLGIYRSSEFVLSPSLKTRSSEAIFMNNSYTESKAKLLFDNIGLVTSYQSLKEDEKGLVMINFGIGYNRLNDFNSETTALGDNSEYSIMDYFTSLANGNDWYDLTPDDDWDPYKNSGAPWAAILAWNSFLIDTVVGDPYSYQAPLWLGDGVYADQSISTEGGMGEYVFSLAANISNKFYLGATLGIQSIYYKQTTYYSETANGSNLPLPNGDLFESMNYNQSLTIEGAGVNLKLGAIYRPLPSLRLGLAAHTPTFFSLDETYSANMQSEFNVRTVRASSPINLYDYKIETPYKLIASAAYTFGKIGLLSVDYEYIDYTTMRFGKGGDGERFVAENNEIKSNFRNTNNIKVGGEFWLKQLALRAGYAYYGSPYKSDRELSSSSINVFSGGFGIRVNKISIDWAYQHLLFSDSYLPYNFAPNVIDRNISQNKFIFTLGFKF